MQNQTIFKLYTDDNKSKYSSNPKVILKSEKKIIKNSTPSEFSELLLLNLFGKFLTERKYLMNSLIFVRLKYLQKKSIKSINSEIINLQVIMALQQDFVNTFQMSQLLSFQMFMTPGENSTLCVLLIEQESYLPYIKGGKKILQTIDPFYF